MDRFSPLRNPGATFGGLTEGRRRPRIVIADGHKLIAEVCKSLIEPEFEVVATVSDGRTLLRAVEGLRPDVVILEVKLPELNGLNAGEQIKLISRSTKLVFLTADLRPDLAAEAFRRGAAGYVLKQCDAEELLIAVRRVLSGESYLSPLITKDTVQFLLRSGAPYEEKKPISARQSEVLQLVAEGKSMKEIASVLRLNPGTVAFHKYRVMDALGLKNTAALIEYAIKHHMISAQ